MKRLVKYFSCTIIFLVLGILCKSNNDYRKIIHYYLYEDSFNFNSIYSFYNKYLGGVSFYDFNDDKKTIMVFDERLKYNEILLFEDGIKLMVDDKYLVPNLENGIVSFIGTKNKYGKVIIVKINNDVNVWYGNICNSSFKLYDYVSKGDYLGESCNNYIYIVYEKDGKFLDYKKYFSY